MGYFSVPRRPPRTNPVTERDFPHQKDNGVAIREMPLITTLPARMLKKNNSQWVISQGIPDIPFTRNIHPSPKIRWERYPT